MKSITRRSFLKIAGAGGATAAASSLLPAPFSPLSPLKKGFKPALKEEWVASVCQQCPAACGIKVKIINGRAVKIEGNSHPSNQGRVCPKGQAGLQILYDPDRIKGPLKRTNPEKGPYQDPLFVPVSWEEALTDIASRLGKLRQEGKSHTVAFMSGRIQGKNKDIINLFAKLYGTPNHVGHSSICADASKLAHYVLDGNKSYAAYDWDNTNYLISFGAGFIEAWRPTVRLLRAYGQMRRGRPIRAKIVQVDTRLSVSATKANEWIPITPGTDGAMALGMAHVILTEGLWSREFVGDFTATGKRFKEGKSIAPEEFQEKWTKGLVDWWNAMLKDFSPKKAAETTGVPVSTIRRLAREFATTPPAIAGAERGAGAHTNGTYNRMCIHALNALVGSMFAFGGVMYQENPPYTPLASEEPYMDDVSKDIDAKVKTGELKRIDKKTGFMENFYQDVADNHLKSDPYKLNMLFIYLTNPLFSTPEPGRFYEAFKDIFIVESTPFLSETATYADYILPDHSYLENTLDVPIYPSLGYPVVGLRQPVVAPLYDTRNFADTLIELGKRAGGKMGDYFSSLGNFENVLKTSIKGLGITWEQWQQMGVWSKGTISYRYKNGRFYKDSQELDEVAVKDKLLKTNSGKFELRSSALEEKGYNPYPQYQTPNYATGPGYDLYLNTPKLITHAEGRGANVPNLQEIFNVEDQTKWEVKVHLHPEAAQKRGIKNGDLVWVESPTGNKIRAQAELFEGCHPQVVVIPYELGHTAYGRWARLRGVNPNWLLANKSDPLSGQSATNDTMVKVYRA
ncbi:MAG: molybdopterin-dependent oxidoreductase [Chloroflexi bacterium]|nr:molybdopterin-dependent oxidoreductase [Chloroflexota bacterium]